MFLKNEFLCEVKWQRFLGDFKQQFVQLISAWSIADLSYIAIINSNDHRSINPDLKDIYKLGNVLAKIEDQQTASRLGKIPQEDLKIHILFGLPQKQFWYQEILKTRNLYNNFLRYYILLSEIPKYFPKLKSPNDDLLEVTGFDIKSFAQLQFAGFSFIQNSPLITFNVAPVVSAKIPVLCQGNIKRYIDLFSADYCYYRKQNFPNNPLFFKPIIRTSTNKLIISNAFIWARKFYEGIYWIIRDKHMREKSQAFINNFGEYYEKYVEELMKFYLQPNQFNKLERENKQKKADWLIHSSDYLLVVEQKSALMTIALKEEYPAIHKLDEYLTNFVEAYTQISETVKTLKIQDRRIVKLILHFEKFYIGETVIKERVNKLCIGKINSLSDYFFIDTEEFENLMLLLSDDEDAFNKVIKAKIEQEDKTSIAEGKEFRDFISKYATQKRNRFFESYRHLIDELTENLFV